MSEDRNNITVFCQIENSLLLTFFFILNSWEYVSSDPSQSEGLVSDLRQVCLGFETEDEPSIPDKKISPFAHFAFTMNNNYLINLPNRQIENNLYYCSKKKGMFDRKPPHFVFFFFFFTSFSFSSKKTTRTRRTWRGHPITHQQPCTWLC